MRPAQGDRGRVALPVGAIRARDLEPRVELLGQRGVERLAQEAGERRRGAAGRDRDGDVAAARIKVRASISSQPKVNLSLPLARLSGGAGGIELSGQARSPRAGLTATALAERTLWSAGAEAWHDIGPVTAYAGTAIAREWDAFEGPHRTRNTYGGIEWEGAGLWGLEHGTWRSALEGRDERETRLSWRHRIARGWSAGVEATEIRGDGWRDRRIGLALRGAL
mgnify:CR=1 FL=1